MPALLSLSPSLCVPRSLTRSDSERSVPIGYMGGTEWCKGCCHGNAQGWVRTQDAVCAKRQGWDQNGIKRLESRALQAEASRTERLRVASLGGRLTDWTGGWNEQPGLWCRVRSKDSQLWEAVMSVSLHSAEHGFTLIKEGLGKSAGSS